MEKSPLLKPYVQDRADASWIDSLRAGFRDAISPEDMGAIAKSLVEKAKAGDMKALDVLMRWLGNPPQQVVVDKMLVMDQRDR